MTNLWALIAIIVGIWFFAVLLAFQALTRKKFGGELWRVYDHLARELELVAKEESSAGYGLPDVIGKIRDRRVIVHPVVGKGLGGLAKTTFAVEHKIRFRGKLAISSTQISRWFLGKFRHQLDVPNFRMEYNISSESSGDQAIMNRLFTTDLAGEFERIVSKDPSNFVTLILESGAAFLYTLGWEDDKEVLKSNLLDTVAFVEHMEKNAGVLHPGLVNLAFLRSTEESKKAFDLCISVVVIVIASILLLLPAIEPASLQAIVFMLNIGLALMVIGLTRAYAALRMRPPEGP